MTDAAVDVRELVKRYPRSSVNAVDAISFQVQRGEVVVFPAPFGPSSPNTSPRST